MCARVGVRVCARVRVHVLRMRVRAFERTYDCTHSCVVVFSRVYVSARARVCVIVCTRTR